MTIQFQIEEVHQVGFEDPCGTIYTTRRVIAETDTFDEAMEVLNELRNQEDDFHFFVLIRPQWYIDGELEMQRQQAARESDPSNPEYIPF